jgi:hypothetical protein
MRRVLSGVMGGLLLFLPSLMAYSVTVPVSEYRAGTLEDYDAFLVACLTLYGGAAIGILVQWRLRAHNRQALSGVDVFWAGFIGATVAVGVALAVASVEEGPGNLWGLLVILGGVFGAIVGAGAGLVWSALRGASAP